MPHNQPPEVSVQAGFTGWHYAYQFIWTIFMLSTGDTQSHINQVHCLLGCASVPSGPSNAVCTLVQMHAADN